MEIEIEKPAFWFFLPTRFRFVGTTEEWNLAAGNVKKIMDEIEGRK
jgi:hypothetical protein